MSTLDDWTEALCTELGLDLDLKDVDQKTVLLGRCPARRPLFFRQYPQLNKAVASAERCFRFCRGLRRWRLRMLATGRGRLGGEEPVVHAGDPHDLDQ
jgi:hypothetical protein